jgi:HlyD family secretion protein
MAVSRRFYSIGAAVLVLALLGAGIFVRIQRTDAANAEAGEGGARPTVSAAETFATDVAIPVEAAEVVRDTLVISVSASGQAEAARRSVILAQVSGRVAALPVRENDRVDAGALLVGLDAAEYELGVARARATVESAEATYRETTLFDDRIADPEIRAERDRVARAKSGLAAAQAELAKAELDLSRTRVTAPFAGRVASIKVVTGQWVRQNDELMTIVELDPIKVEVQVLEGEVGYLAPGGRARVSFAAFPDEVFAGTIETINPVIDQTTRTAKVTVTVPNRQGRILPGMYARVSLEARHFPDRILVPRSAILERDVNRRKMLFVYQDGLAKWRYVTTGLENETHVEIVENPETEMVRPGEKVLVGGHHTLIHDAKVRLVDDVRSAGGRPN